ncbi:SAM-dependent methyltransferase [Winogradskya humida]|uniref:Cyclopropane-fatty-acyl-phospholipid synthase n=1 Tax=Winogradskya humida TaxID=113566 RepID=A0ABQ3ZUD8_9ACTN|nr:cyclopropane-fatty-acyl-phospholipid synthase family protein [Actinoplanes humidus]GIE22073.1 cyclopropane-fatty-acyl-phospholipid synthase [Actinoplanes humidus]
MTAVLSLERGVAPKLASLIAGVAGGSLPVRLRAWDGSEAGPATGPTLVIRDRQALRRLLWSPNELGIAQAYIAGEIDVEGDLRDGLRQVWQHARSNSLAGFSLTWADRLRALRTVLSLGVLGSRPAAPEIEARIDGSLHSRERDRAAIAYHYDLSNRFYQLILDARMAYSCAYWTSDEPGYGLAEAQTDKLDLICQKLGLEPGMRLLDIGCGWGALALHAARNYGVRVTGVTLSAQQREFVLERVGDLPVEIRLQDYRDVTDGPYDAISTIEMGEHVGEDQYPVFAAQLHNLVRPGGKVLVQQMSRGANAPGGGAFIESYVAPDMHMRPLGRTIDLLAGSGLEVRGVQALREHYVRTVDAWHATLESRWSEAVALVGEPMARVWRLYLVGGALAFEEGRMGVDQILLQRNS